MLDSSRLIHSEVDYAQRNARRMMKSCVVEDGSGVFPLARIKESGAQSFLMGLRVVEMLSLL